MMPAPTPADVMADRDWFASHPRRRYHVRRAATGIWLVRKRTGGVFLRAWTASLPRGVPDTDDALREQWYAAAWADLDPATRDELIRADKAGGRD
jgi:hypothetical protein